MLRLFFIILILVNNFLLLSSCFVEPFSLHIKEPIACGTSSSKIVKGLFDISVKEDYVLSIFVSNGLAVNSSSAKLQPETQYIKLKTARIWFEYPKPFSVPPNPKLYKETHPYTVSIRGRLEPGIISDAITGAAGGGAGASAAEGGALTPPAILMSFRFRLSETVALWQSAAELIKVVKPKTTLSSTSGFFTVNMHVQLTGITGTYQDLTSNTLVLPIEICSGCLNQVLNPRLVCIQSGEKAKATTNSGEICYGQDGLCLPKTPGTK